MSVWPPEFTVEGERVLIETLSHNHLDDLIEAAADGDLHKLWYTFIPKPEDVEKEIDRRLGLREQGSMLPFAVIDKESGRAVGMTTYMNIDAPHKRVEIGSTWYRKAVQRSSLNSECKLLLLKHAFEELDCVCVEFRTHFINHQSRRAIERLGAKLDGVLRSNYIMPNGSIRDTAVYSIIAHEWPTVKAHLEWQLEKPRN
ncbi:GNAT family N-acetyltransferase [Pseudemcibacter aquimaris]|uniref:GNAT family N-acetyltransferase n=1 Tax=Pseudemcibacter aquimaris TaxID=2857064 RepID=UPI002010E270|nr:GNAT family protein [Pseudemcibacter aquimaris]MCC3861060.1 GNAT family N-acetyltransferase [Pseudemcibacter aquimaris]WDU59878.1 GNAT family N-acetyltransferase [Pseudemcibacter aquimaris]